MADRITNYLNEQMKERITGLDMRYSGGNGEIVFLDVRKAVPAGQWFDELHPTTKGFGALAKVFSKKIDELHALAYDGGPLAAEPALPEPEPHGHG